MSYIQSSFSEPIEGVSSGLTIAEGTLSVPVRLEGVSAGSTTCVGILSGGEPVNVSEGRTTGLGTLAVGRVFGGTSAGSTVCEGSLIIGLRDSFTLNLAIDILPIDYDPELWQPRLKVNGVEYPVGSGVFTQSASFVGSTLSASIPRLEDRTVMVAGALVEFGIGKKIAGNWDESTFITLMVNGEIEETSYTLGWQDNAPTDTFTIKAVSESTSRLGKTPTRMFVMYDSAMQTLDPNEFRIQKDTEGRLYEAELKPVPRLKLSQVLHEIFVLRCGYPSYRTNIANDYNVPIIDFPLGETYSSAIKGFLGNNAPIIEEINGELWIIDTTVTLPANFPMPRAIDTSRYNTASVVMNASNIDGADLQFTETRQSYDYITTDFETELISSGEFGDPDYQTTLVQRGYRVYKKLSYPTLELRRELYLETQVTTSSEGTIGDIREQFSYDELCRMYNRTKRIQSFLPDVENPGDYDLRDSSGESEVFTYAAHPFQGGRQFLSRREIKESGLIVVDVANPQLGETFEQPYDEADTKGNLTVGQTTRFGPIRTLIEKNTPQRSGMLKVEYLEFYHARSGRTKRVPRPSKEVPADVSFHAAAPAQDSIYVWENPDAVPSERKLIRLNAGPMPLPVAIPWARRQIKHLQEGILEGEFSVERYDPGLQKGVIVALTGRPSGVSDELLGYFMIEGLAVPFGEGYVTVDIHGRQIPVDTNYILGPDDPQAGFSNQVETGETLEYNFPIDCFGGYELVSNSVADLTVEARIAGGGGWTNIETTPISLSPYAGTRQDFEFRMIAGATSQLLKRDVKITTRPIQ